MPVITIIFWNSAGYCPCCSLFYHQFLDFAMAPNHDWRPCNSMHQLHQLLIPMAPPPEMLGWGIDLHMSQRFKHYRYLSCTVGETQTYIDTYLFFTKMYDIYMCMLSALYLRVYIKEVCTHISENEKFTSHPCYMNLRLSIRIMVSIGF